MGGGRPPPPQGYARSATASQRQTTHYTHAHIQIYMYIIHVSTIQNYLQPPRAGPHPAGAPRQGTATLSDIHYRFTAPEALGGGSRGGGGGGGGGGGHGCFITLKPWTKRLRPLIRNFFIATDLIMTLATHLFLWMDLFVQTVSIQCRRCLCTVSTMSTGINDVHLWRYRSILDVALACKSTG